MASNASLQRHGGTLVLAGVLDRAAVAALWPQALAQLHGAAVVDITGVTQLDSAGLALLAELAGRIRHHGSQPVVTGERADLDELRNAYRLSPSLDFQT